MGIINVDQTTMGQGLHGSATTLEGIMYFDG